MPKSKIIAGHVLVAAQGWWIKLCLSRPGSPFKYGGMLLSRTWSGGGGTNIAFPGLLPSIQLMYPVKVRMHYLNRCSEMSVSYKVHWLISVYYDGSACLWPKISVNLIFEINSIYISNNKKAFILWIQRAAIVIGLFRNPSTANLKMDYFLMEGRLFSWPDL